MAGIEVTRTGGRSLRGEGRSAAHRAKFNVSQQEIVLKNALSRNAMANAWLDELHVIPMDLPKWPKSDEIRPIQDLVTEALQKNARGDRAGQHQSRQ